MLKSPAPIASLSRRESEVARAYSKGLSYREIADDLGISPATVRTHINTIFRKLEVSNKLELLRVVEAVDVAEAQPINAPVHAQRRWPLLAGAAAAVVLALGIALWSFWPGNQTVAEVHDGPSIAIMPFDVSGGDPDAIGVLDAINRDIVTDLTQFSDIFVIADRSSFAEGLATGSAYDAGRQLGVRYVLSGTGDWRADSLRVNVQLLETATGRVVWSERFDTVREKLLEFQTNVVTRVVGVIGPVDTGNGRLRQVELERIARRATDSPDAYDLFIEGMTVYEKFTAEDNQRARALFEAAIERDPNYGKAYAMAAWTLVLDVWRDRVDDRAATLARADALLRKGAEVDRFEPYLSWSRGGYHLFAGNHEQAIASYREAVDLNPNGADHMMFLGWAMVYVGQAEAALEVMQEGVRRNPYHPGWYLWDLAFANLFSHNYDEAVAILEKREPKTPGTYQLLAVGYARAGDKEAATKAMAELLGRRPDFSVDLIARTEPFQSKETLDWYLDSLRMAGAPETSG